MKLELTENAKTVLKARYLLRNLDGKVIETPLQLFERVARVVAAVEPKDSERWREKFLKLMVSRRFMPNSPTLMNAGKPEGQLSACYVLPVADSLDGIFDALKYAAKIHQSGGGTGFSFSRLRHHGARVKTTSGVASGPVSFIRIFDQATETIKQGGTRRGANMGILRVDHPDVREFVEAKRDLKSMTNFNLSVGMTDAFFRAVSAGEAYGLFDAGRDAGTAGEKAGEKVAEADALEIFRLMSQCAWESGDPGLVFLDRMNLLNPTPLAGTFESTNPCGEQPLLAFESCNLGSLNLGLYLSETVPNEVNWKDLKVDIQTATRFLDNVIDANEFPLAESQRVTLANRKIGLGVMGFADLLVAMGIPYESDEAVALGEQVMAFVDRVAKETSAALALEKGAFPNFEGSMWDRLGYPPLRNATVSTVAPTGTISMIAGASSGIEPIFSAVFFRKVLGGQKLVEVHPSLKGALEKQSRDVSVLQDTEIEEILDQELGLAWMPSHRVSVSGHLLIQAAFQRFSDSAVSKTINLPHSATVEDVQGAYLLAYRVGCKGITIYRDQSRPEQVLNSGLEAKDCPTCI